MLCDIKKNPLGVLVVTPYYGGIDGVHLECMDRLKAGKVPVATLLNTPYIDMARAYLATTAMDNNYRYVFFIDHDILFEAEDVIGMTLKLDNLPDDVVAVAAPYVMKNSRRMIMGYEDSVKTVRGYSDELLPIRHAGFGFTVLRVSALRLMGERYPRIGCPTTKTSVYPLFSHILDYEKNIYYGEDLSFFIRAKECGLKSFSWSKPRLAHRGNYDFTLEDAGLKVQRFATLDITIDDSVDAKPTLINKQE